MRRSLHLPVAFAVGGFLALALPAQALAGNMILTIDTPELRVLATSREAPAIAELVARLEGIPLAIELAAAHMRTLSVTDINARLEDRYKLLTGGGRVLLERQQTLRALVDWSYDLLPENDQRLLARLSAFAGGFDLAAAAVVRGTEPLAAEDIVDLLASLVDKSFVMPEEAESGTRYRMLETIRDYARIKLVERGELEGTLSRHANYCFELAKAARDGVKDAARTHWIGRLEAEHDNLRAAIAYSMGDTGDPIVAVKMEVALQEFRTFRGYASERRNNLRALLALPSIAASDLARAHVLYVGAALAYSQGDHREAERMLEMCLSLRRQIGKEVDIAGTLSTLAVVRLQLGDAVAARAGEEEALALFRKVGERYGEAIALLHLGMICAYVGKDVEARRFVEESLAISREIRNQSTEGDCERTLGQLPFEGGDLTAARGRFASAQAVIGNA